MISSKNPIVDMNQVQFSIFPETNLARFHFSLCPHSVPNENLKEPLKTFFSTGIDEYKFNKF